MMSVTAEIGVIGGTGFYSLFEQASHVAIKTPYGEPSAEISIGMLGGRSVAFLPRHGPSHDFLPHEINYRANIWALRRIGTQQILAPCAAGSLTSHLLPGTLAVPTQLVDRTVRREHTYFSGRLAHVPFAEPYCSTLREVVLKAAASEEIPVADGGTMVIIEGPRFSTRAESQWLAREGASLINMTGQPEAILARELGMCYVTLALVTDFDAGTDNDTTVAQNDVLKVFERNIEVLRGLVEASILSLPEQRICQCLRALDGIEPAFQFSEVGGP